MIMHAPPRPPRIHRLVATGAAVLLASCAASDGPTDPLLDSSPQFAKPAHAGGGGSSDIELRVRMRDDASLPDRVTSDGHGDYVHDVDRVEAFIDGDFGQFVFDTDTDKGPAPSLTRTVCFDFSDRADADDPSTDADDPPFLEGCVDPKWNVTDTGVSGGLAGLTEGEVVTGRSRFVWSDDTTDSQYFLIFGSTDRSDPDRVTVTRLDADTWTVESAADQVARLEEGSTKGPATRSVVGEWHMPLQARLERR